MPKAIIAPSVLASDLSNLSNECKRMLGDGADWLHMGAYLSSPVVASVLSEINTDITVNPGAMDTDIAELALPMLSAWLVFAVLPCSSWRSLDGAYSPSRPSSPRCATGLTADVMDGHFVPNITMGPPILSCVRDNVPDIFMDCHMMVSDPAKVRPSRGGGGLPLPV